MIVPRLDSMNSGVEQDGLGNLYIGNFINDKYDSSRKDLESDPFKDSLDPANQHSSTMDISLPSLYLWFADGDVYRGSFKSGMMEGFGEMINFAEQSRYIGYFKEGARAGIGHH